MRLFIYKCCLACTVILGSVSGIFRHIQEHTHTYSEPCVSLPNSEPWHIQTPRYIHNTILNIFTKAPSWTFDTVLNAPLLQMLPNFQSNFIASLTLYFRHIQAYSRLTLPYLILLRHIKNSGIFRNILLQVYSKRYTLYSSIFRFPAYLSTLCFSYVTLCYIEACLPTFGYISTDSGIFRILGQLDIFMYIKNVRELS